MCDVAIVIVSFNVRELLRGCLHSVYATAGASFEVTVVDNSSGDGSVEMVQWEFPGVRVIASPANVGFAAGNNLALRELQARPERERPRYVLLLNPDTVLPENGLSAMVSYLDSHPTAGAAGPKLVRADGSLDLACRRSFPSPEVSLYRMLGLSRRFPQSRRFGKYNMTYLDPDVETEVDSVVGAYMMVRWKAFEDVGLLDEAFFMYGEDLDWAFRLKQRGWSVNYYPALKVLHYKGQSSRQHSWRAMAAFYQAMVIFYRKHYASGRPAVFNWFVLGAVHLIWGLAWTANALRPASRRRVGSTG